MFPMYLNALMSPLQIAKNYIHFFGVGCKTITVIGQMWSFMHTSQYKSSNIECLFLAKHNILYQLMPVPFLKFVI